jgi:hypothetical protein
MSAVEDDVYDLDVKTNSLTRFSTWMPLLFLAVCGIAGLTLLVAVYNATRRDGERDALTYSVVRRDLTDQLKRTPDGSFLRDAIAAVPTVESIAHKGRTITIASDSLIIKDSVRFPSLRTGGFLSDEVNRYNKSRRLRIAQVRRGVGILPGQTFVDLRQTDNPSIFRSVGRISGRGEPDTVLLAEQAITSGMRVASPFESRQAITITSRNAPLTSALVSGAGISIFRNDGTTPGSFGCPFTVHHDSVSIKCREPNGPRKEILFTTDLAGVPNQLRVFSDDIVRYDGLAVKSGELVDIKRGGLLLLPPSMIAVRGATRKPAPQPSAIEQTGSGTFGGVQWVNGRMQWRSNPQWRSSFLRQLTTGSGFAGEVGLLSGRVIPLSLDDRLTMQTQAKLEEFLRTSPNGGDVSYATVVVADAHSGEILGLAEAGQPLSQQGSWLLKATNFGSAVKPILAASVLLERPELASLKIYGPGADVMTLWGRPLNSPLSTNCGTGWIDLRKFLSCSSNLFAASLTSAGLQSAANKRVEWEAGDGGEYTIGGKSGLGRRPHLPMDARGRIDPDSLFGSALSFGLDSLFGIQTGIEYTNTQSSGRDSSIWIGLHYLNGPPLASPPGLWPDASRVALALRGETATLREVAAMAIGASENRLTPFMLLQSFARIVTDTRLALRLSPIDDIPVLNTRLGLRNTPWYPAMLGGLQDVTRKGGTAFGVGDGLSGIAGPQTQFLAKTGTLNAEGGTALVTARDSVVGEGQGNVTTATHRTRVTIPPVALKTLLFAVGQPADPKSPRLQCGIVGSIYFRFRSSQGDHTPELAQQFAREQLWPVLGSNWKRLGTCRNDDSRMPAEAHATPDSARGLQRTAHKPAARHPVKHITRHMRRR